MDWVHPRWTEATPTPVHEPGPTPTDALTGAVATGMLAATCTSGVRTAGGEVVGGGETGDWGVGGPPAPWPPLGSDLGVVWAGEPPVGRPVDATTPDIEGRAVASCPLGTGPAPAGPRPTAPPFTDPPLTDPVGTDTGPAAVARLVSAAGPAGEAGDPGAPEAAGDGGPSAGPM